MKLAIIGSRNLIIENIGEYLPKECNEIISGGAKGIDTCAAVYATQKGIKLTEFLPEYKRYGKGAPIIRNKLIVDCADEVIAFWNGKSKGTFSVIEYCKRTCKPCRTIIIKQ